MTNNNRNYTLFDTPICGKTWKLCGSIKRVEGDDFKLTISCGYWIDRMPQNFMAESTFTITLPPSLSVKDMLDTTSLDPRALRPFGYKTCKINELCEVEFGTINVKCEYISLKFVLNLVGPGVFEFYLYNRTSNLKSAYVLSGPFVLYTNQIDGCIGEAEFHKIFAGSQIPEPRRRLRCVSFIPRNPKFALSPFVKYHGRARCHHLKSSEMIDGELKDIVKSYVVVKMHILLECRADFEFNLRIVSDDEETRIVASNNFKITLLYPQMTQRTFVIPLNKDMPEKMIACLYVSCSSMNRYTTKIVETNTGSNFLPINSLDEWKSASVESCETCAVCLEELSLDYLEDIEEVSKGNRNEILTLNGDPRRFREDAHGSHARDVMFYESCSHMLHRSCMTNVFKNQMHSIDKIQCVCCREFCNAIIWPQNKTTYFKFRTSANRNILNPFATGNDDSDALDSLTLNREPKPDNNQIIEIELE